MALELYKPTLEEVYDVNKLNENSTKIENNAKLVDTAIEKCNENIVQCNTKITQCNTKIGELQESSNHFAKASTVIVSGVQGYKVEIPEVTKYYQGLNITVQINADNKPNPFIVINSLPAVTIHKTATEKITKEGELKATKCYTFVYSDSRFFLSSGEGSGIEDYGTVTTGDVLKGKTFVTEDGLDTGTLELTGTALASQVLSGKTFYNTNAKSIVTGTMTNRGGGVTITLTTYNQAKYAGYYSGDIVVRGDSNLTSSNIKNGVSIFGVTGNYVGGTTTLNGTATSDKVLNGYTFYNTNANTKVTGTMTNRGTGGTVVPKTYDQTKYAGYYSSNITVKGDSNLTASNIKSGVSIFGVTGNYTGGASLNSQVVTHTKNYQNFSREVINGTSRYVTYLSGYATSGAPKVLITFARADITNSSAIVSPETYLLCYHHKNQTDFSSRMSLTSPNYIIEPQGYAKYLDLKTGIGTTGSNGYYSIPIYIYLTNFAITDLSYFSASMYILS